MKISISCDDGSKEDIKIAKLCNKYGVDCVFYWPVDIEGLSIQKGWEHISPDNELAISRDFEIGSHTITHRYLTQIPFEEAVDEIVASKKILEEKYDQNISKFCYPRGYASEQLCKVVAKAGYSLARSTEIGHIGKPDNPFFAPSAVHMGCPVRVEYQGTNWFDYGLKLLEQAREQDKDFHGWMHGWEVTRYNEWISVEKFIKELSK